MDFSNTYAYSHFCTSVIQSSELYKSGLKKIYKKLSDNVDSRYYTANSDKVLLILAQIYNECLNYRTIKNTHLVVARINRLLKELAQIDSGSYYFHVSNFIETGIFKT